MLGLVAAFAGGVLDIAIMRLMDVLLVFPSLLLAIVVVAILGPGLTNAMLAVAVVLLPGYVRLSRAAALGELTREYVVATRSAGAGVLRLMLLVVLPNCAAPLIVQATLGFSGRHPRRGGARLPRPRRATANAGVGHHARRRAAILSARLVDAGVPRHRHPGHGDGIQPAGRRPPRCALDPKLRR